jgi:arabinogalactan endo-1,4-beta-galactosidase
MLPIVFPTVVKSNNYTIAQLYQLSYEEGVRWTELYGRLFSVVELDNEQDNVCIKPGADGISLDDYNRSCIDRVVAKMSGFAAGLKDTLSSLRIIIDFGWLHWGYMDYLTAASTRYDIVGYHWYSNMGDIRRSYKNISDVLQHVIHTYKKPIWITETNTENGDMNVPSYNQTSYINNTLNTILTYYPAVQSYVIYELFDEYQFSNSSGEAHYGLTKLVGGTRSYKPIATAYQMWVDQYHQNICQQCHWAAQDSSQLVCAGS